MDQESEADRLGEEADDLFSSGQYERAVDNYLQAVEVAFRQGDPRSEAHWLGNLGVALISLGRPGEAIGSLERALPVAQGVGDGGWECFLLQNLGTAYCMVQQFATARGHLEAGLRIAQVRGDKKQETSLKGSLGTVFSMAGLYHQAGDSYEAALSLARELSDEQQVGLWLGNLGHNQAAQGEFKQALTCYDEALRLAEKVGDNQNRQRWEEGRRAASDRLQEREAVRAVHAVTRLSEKTSTELLAAGVRATSADGITLIEMFHSNEELTLFVLRIDCDRPRVATVPVPKDELNSVLDQFFQRMFASPGPARDVGVTPSPDVVPDAAWQTTLGSWVWEPIRQWVPPSDLIVWVPYGVFHALPLHLVPESGQPLLLSHPVVYAPSAAVLRQCQRRNPARVSEGFRPQKAITYGIDFESEAVAVARAFAAGKAYLASQGPVSAQLIRESSRGADVLHFSCHGVYNSRSPRESGLLLKPAVGPGQRRIIPSDLLTMEDIYTLELESYLVTLGACNSAAGSPQPGDELMGLVRGFLYAGTPSVLASLWPVPDEPTVLLMTTFYEALLQGCNKARALQAAQRTVAQRFADPFCWGAFVLIGDWL